MTLEYLQREMTIAMKEADTELRDVLRSAIGAIKKTAIDKRCEITEELINDVLIKEAKILQEQIDTCPIERQDTANEYKSKLVKLKIYLPKIMNDPEEIRAIVIGELAAAEEEQQKLRYQKVLNKLELEKIESERRIAIQADLNRATEAEKAASRQAERDLQKVLDEIHQAGLARKQNEYDQEQRKAEAEAVLEQKKQEAYAKTVADIMASISPELVAALTSKSNENMLIAVTEAIGPYALAKNESVADVTNKLLRGTSLEEVIKDVNLNV